MRKHPRPSGSDQDFAYFGASAETAGDVNGDGYSDVIVGASPTDNGETNEGVALAFLGSAGGIMGSNPVSAHVLLESDQANAYLGTSVGTAGDVNGDGYSDVIVGAREYDNGQTDEGVVLVFLYGRGDHGLEPG